MTQQLTSTSRSTAEPAASLVQALGDLRYELLPVRGVEAQVEHLPPGAIGGDAPEPWGPYPSAWHLLAALHELDHGFESVGVAAYPESHPVIDDAALVTTLHTKQPLATLSHYRPDDFLLAAEPHRGCETCGIEGFHTYAFNQVERVETWRHELLASLAVRGASSIGTPPPP